MDAGPRCPNPSIGQLCIWFHRCNLHMMNLYPVVVTTDGRAQFEQSRAPWRSLLLRFSKVRCELRTAAEPDLSRGNTRLGNPICS